MRRFLTTTLILLAALAVPMQASAGYLADRGNDFLDIFRFRAGVPRHGEGYGAKVRATALAQAGFVHYNGSYWGLDRRAFGLVEEQRTEGGVSLAYASTHNVMPYWGNMWLDEDTIWHRAEERHIVRNLPYWDNGRGHFFSLETEVATPIFGIDLGLYPTEAIDFLTGIVTIDPWNDDASRIARSYEYRPAYIIPSTDPEPDMDAAENRKRLELMSLTEDGGVSPLVGQDLDRDDFDLRAPTEVGPYEAVVGEGDTRIDRRNEGGEAYPAMITPGRTTNPMPEEPAGGLQPTRIPPADASEGIDNSRVTTRAVATPQGN
ncbi:MAG: hypothetical protein RLY93_10550 [Sumerlaeia bacterium]